MCIACLIHLANSNKTKIPKSSKTVSRVPHLYLHNVSDERKKNKNTTKNETAKQRTISRDRYGFYANDDVQQSVSRYIFPFTFYFPFFLLFCSQLSDSTNRSISWSTHNYRNIALAASKQHQHTQDFIHRHTLCLTHSLDMVTSCDMPYQFFAYVHEIDGILL